VSVFIAGLGKGGAAFLEILKDLPNVNVVGALDKNPSALGVGIARKLFIPVYTSLDEISGVRPEIVLNVTGDDNLELHLSQKFKGAVVLSGKGSKFFFELLNALQMDTALYQALYNSTLTLLSSKNHSEILNSIMKEVLKVTCFPAGSIALYDQRSRSFLLAFQAGLSKRILSISSWKPRKGGLTHNIINSREQPLVIEDIDNADIDINPVLKEEGIRAIAACKLEALDEVLGILYVDDFKPRSITVYERKALRLFAQIAGLALQKIKLIEENRELALTDGLTGLNNHRYFHERLKQELSRVIRGNKNLSLLLVDVDYFKKYNDANGHLAGDDVLKKIATLIRRNIRAGDVACRYGGEEFVVILPDTNKQQAVNVAERIREAVERESFTGEEVLPTQKITVSIGVATFPEDAHGKDELIKKADDAMYEAKLRGKNCVVPAGEEI